MDYHDIKGGIISALKARDTSNPLTAVVAAPYSLEVINAIDTVCGEGFLEQVILIGDPTKIPDPAEMFGLKQGYTIIALDNEQDIAAEAALQSSKVGSVVVKGNISSGTLLRALLSSEKPDNDKQATKQAEQKLIASHVYLINSPSFPDRVLFTADAGVNIHPGLTAKMAIIHNVLGMVNQLNVGEVRVALIAAMEKENSAMQSTIDAVALCKLAKSGHFNGAALNGTTTDRAFIDGPFIDGPMALDAAMLPTAAVSKGLSDVVAGRANVLIFDNIEAANSTSKALIGVQGEAMGVVLGAQCPIAFPSRGDSEKTRVDSLLLAVYLSMQAAKNV